MANFPYQAGVDNDLIDELNAVGGTGLSDKVPSGVSNLANIKVGTVSVTAAKLTESATASFAITGFIFSQIVEVSTAGASFVATTADATATTVTFTRGTSAAADSISYIFIG